LNQLNVLKAGLLRTLLTGFMMLAFLGGCMLAPGMNMKAGRFDVQQADNNDFREGVVIQPINGALVQHQLAALRQSEVMIRVPQVLRENIADYQYRVAVQDVLQITVWDHPELTTPAGQYRASADSGNLVRKDGTIFYPYIGVVHVIGKTMEEIRLELSAKLARYIEQPQLDVRVASFRGQRAYVTGQVNKPGVFPITDQALTVVEAIAQAGGTTPEADLQHALLTRDGMSYVLDLFSLYERGASDLNILLKHGDVLNVPDNHLNKVFVMGEVVTPATLLLRNGRLTLAEAVSDSGSFGSSANPGELYVIRSAYTAEHSDKGTDANQDHPHNGTALVDRFDANASLEIYHLDASSPDALLLADQFHLQARDVVYVSPTELSRFSKVFSDVGRIINTTAQTVILQRTLRK